MRRVTHTVSDLKPGEVFVFGSNLSGIHGAGAAFTALKWGAVRGQGIGLQGRTYAIPTVTKKIRGPMSIASIKIHVREFLTFAKNNPDLRFLVTEIGCGLAGFKPQDIAPLFKGAEKMANVWLPESFLNILEKEENVE